MEFTREKIDKLIDIAKLYYEEDKTQSEIAKIYGVSRPLVSRFLKEAKEAGIVNIRIGLPVGYDNINENNIKKRLGIEGIVTVKYSGNDNDTNRDIAVSSMNLIKSLKGGKIGIGWGTAIGQLIQNLEEGINYMGYMKSVCPLVGNSGVSNRNYHSNEIVRIFSEHTKSHADYIYSPAFAETSYEMELIKRLENYKTVYEKWENIDIALVNIGNYPSVPDFASGARYGTLLMDKKAVGRLLAYYYDAKGEIIYSDTDYAIQIPVKLLQKCKNVIGICSSNVTPRALLGAVNTGVINYIVAVEETVKGMFELAEK